MWCLLTICTTSEGQNWRTYPQICLLFRSIKGTQEVKMTKMGRWTLTASSYTPFTSSTAKGVRSVPAGFKDNVSRDQCSSKFEGTVSRDQCSSRFLR